MRFERLTPAGDPTALAEELRALVPAPESVTDEVAEIIARVRANGDDALRYYTRRFDTGGSTPAALRVPDGRARHRRRAPRRGRSGRAWSRRSPTSCGWPRPRCDEDRTVSFDGHEVYLREAPVRRAAVYVPGGRAPYPSTVVMGVVTARVAGVSEIAVCAPPGHERRGRLGGAGRLPPGRRVGRVPDGRSPGDRRAGLRDRDRDARST